jgi:hypothetical protein
MKKLEKNTKLALSKESVRKLQSLNEAKLNQVAGGFSVGVCSGGGTGSNWPRGNIC